MATAMNITVGPWVRDGSEADVAAVLAEAHALRAAMLAETEALCEEWLAEADDEAQAILTRADAQAAAILEAARQPEADVASETADDVVMPTKEGFLGRARRLFRRR